MRFVCDSCRAQYMISDEKVGPKGVKVRCKKCGYVILVKKADANGHGAKSAPPQAPVPLSNDPDDALATQVMQNPLGGSPSATLPTGDEGGNTNPFAEEKTTQMAAQGNGLLDASEDEIGAVFDQVLNSGAHSIPKGAKGEDRNDRPAVGDDADDRLSTRVLDADTVKKLADETADGKNGHSGKEVPKTDWFVAIDDKQTGPLTLDKIKEHWERGEIGPDSLCWRAGFSDWIPVSEVADLASELAPRPSKPVVVAPVTVGGMSGSVVSVPIESAFSAGGVMQSVRGQVQVPLANASPEETGSWRPSAASALASLVKEEMEALAKPPSKSDPGGLELPAMSSGGLLNDLPEASMPAKSKGVNGHGAPKLGDAPGEMTAMHGPRNPYIGSPGATYSAPGVTQYRPPSDSNKTAILAIVAFSIVAVLGIGAFVVVNVMNNKPTVSTPPTQPLAPPTQPTQPPPTQMANQNPPTAQPGQPTAQPGQPTAPATANGTPPANATGQPPPANPNNQAANGAKPTAAPKTVLTKPPPSEGHTVAMKEKEPSEKPPKEEKVAKAPEPKGGDDEFAAAFGAPKADKKEKAAEKSSDDSSGSPKKSSVYIPPAPGGGGNIPETLGQADVMEVVKANIGAIKKCVDEQKTKDPGTKGRMSMKWQIQTSGKVSKVECVTDEFKTSYLAGCIGGLIKTWQFPKHKTQGDPIVFPFTF